MENGGLGVKDIQKVNYALLTKWKWRLGVGEEGVWRDVIESKYGNWQKNESFYGRKVKFIMVERFVLSM